MVDPLAEPAASGWEPAASGAARRLPECGGPPRPPESYPGAREHSAAWLEAAAAEQGCGPAAVRTA
ncbi:MAG: hypothetical protein ACO1SX_10535, partial [Actinomycetota bacterium]